MKCRIDTCEATRFYDRGTISTCMGVGSYIEGDEHHFHDPNSHARQYVCGNGHHFSIAEVSRCPVPNCSWGTPGRDKP